MLNKLYADIWAWVQQQWGLISSVPVPFSACVLVVSGAISYLCYLYIDQNYRERILILQASIQLQSEQMSAYKAKLEQVVPKIEREPKLMLSAIGGDIFSPDAPDVRDRLTGIVINADVWNTGSPSIATEWSLIVIPQGHLPVIAQLTEIPDLLRASGPINSAVIRGSDALDKRTKREPVGAQIIEGPLLFYVPLSRDVVLDKTTRLELTVKDVNGKATTVSKLMGDWLSR